MRDYLSDVIIALLLFITVRERTQPVERFQTNIEHLLRDALVTVQPFVAGEQIDQADVPLPLQ